MILVTGGAGFIGSNLVAALAERDNTPVVVCDRLEVEEKARNLEKHVVAEIVAPEDLFDWLEESGEDVETVFHMGASSATTETDFDHLLENNFGVSMGLWRWCAEGERRLIYASSAATYGNGAEGFEDDNDPAVLVNLRPLNPYGWSKQLFDLQAVLLGDAGPRPAQWAGLKFFNVFGPNEYHKGGQCSVVVQLFNQISSEGKVRLFRSHDPEFEDGGQKRDFIWVGDCVDVMLWLHDNRQVNGIFNCGTGQARSFTDLATACFAAMDRPVDIHYIDTPPEIRQHYQYFTEAAMDRLAAAGYGRPFTSLEDGVARYIGDYLATNDPYR
ncbi:MAG: ADP-glyceromanno-heptose 6-epimerase [Alphaproteobacteria bacterium]|jgi:ADP-L-glycero-D-manno-heptose 6-epimerase|nr:ADP-glyceromanno-heptose 6-epimerase [Alphaproteobacteria bacterium]